MKKIALLVSIVILAATAVALINQEPKPIVWRFDDLNIDTDGTIAAGEAIEVTVSGLTIGQDGLLTVETSTGWFNEEFTATSETENFEITTRGPISGLVEVSVVTQQSAASSTVVVSPGDAVTPVPVFTGQRTAEVGGAESTMAVAIPIDMFGNPVASETEVDFQVTRPNESSTVTSVFTENFIAAAIFETQTESGRSTVRVNVSDQIGREESFLEVPSRVTDIAVNVSEPLPTADGRTTVVVNLSGLVDEFGNIISDGSLVNLIGQGPNGSLSVSGVSIEGQAELSFSAPSAPGELTFVATARGYKTEPITLEFAPAITSFVTSLSPSEDVLTIGPVRLDSGVLAPPGTEAKILFDNGQSLIVDLLQGEAAVKLDGLEPTSVELLGTEVEVQDG